MANRKLSIGCVLILGGAITNCGGVVETRSDDDGTEHAGASGSGFIGAGAGPVGLPGSGGSFGTIAGGAPGTFVGTGIGVGGCCLGTGGAPGTRPIEMDVGAGAGGASAGDGNWGGAGDSAGDGNSAGDGAIGTAPIAGDHG